MKLFAKRGYDSNYWSLIGYLLWMIKMGMFVNNDVRAIEINNYHLVNVAGNLSLFKDTSSSSTGLNRGPSLVPFVIGGGHSKAPQHINQDHSGGGGDPIDIKELMTNFETQLKQIRNTEMGIPYVQEILNAMEFVSVVQNDSLSVAHMAEKLTAKLTKFNRIIKDIRRYIVNVLLDTTHRVQLETIIQSWTCQQQNTEIPANNNSNNQTSSTDLIKILNLTKPNELLTQIDDDNNATINHLLRHTIESINNTNGNLNFKNIYFLSLADFNIKLPQKCQHLHETNVHFGNLLTSSIKNKHILLLVDHGSSLNSDQLELTKLFAIRLINMLNDHDSIGLIAIADKIQIFRLAEIKHTKNDDKFHKMYPATVDHRLQMIKFIKSLNRTKEPTNHTLGFQMAFQLLHMANLKPIVAHLLVYVSRGLLSPLTEAKSVLEAIANGQKILPMPIVINTCAIVLDEKRIMYEKQFLKDVAMQNYSKYNINVSEWLDRQVTDVSGRLFVVNKQFPDEIMQTSAIVFSTLFHRPYIETRLIAHLPVADNNNEIIVSMSQACGESGIIGIDLYLTDIAEDVIYYEKYKNSYAFIIDMAGMVVWHPTYPRPLAMKSVPYPTNIVYLETIPGFKAVYERMLNEINGTETLFHDKQQMKMIKYTWHRASHFYIICIAMIHNKSQIYLNPLTATGQSNFKPSDFLSIPKFHHYHSTNDDNDDPELLYYRLDLILPKQPLCKYFGQVATMESGTLFLSAASFKSPFVYLKNVHKDNKESRANTAKSIMAYIKDTTKVLANPGLQPKVKNDVMALFHIMVYLKKRHLDDGPMQKYIIRRYVATINGVVQIYPGCLLSPDMEPLRRPWFQKAMENPGRLVMTEPYLDAGGAGYIVTMSHTVFESKTSIMDDDSPADKPGPIAIVSIDLTVGIIYKMLQESATFCTDTNVKCFLMENHGFLVAHPSMLEPSTNQNQRRALHHITHKESFVANDILHHRLFVQKKLCSNYFNRTNQRFYQFNLSMTDVLTNVVNNERIKYQMALIPGTNVFVGILNSSCDGGAFCPCSTVNRQCLNCMRMEQTYCECPCECPLTYSFDNFNATIATGNGEQHQSSQQQQPSIDVCESESEDIPIVNLVPSDLDMNLKPCVTINCETYLTLGDCLGVMGCEWCQVDVDGESLFAAPFCTQQSSCFNGALGSMTPYGDGDLGIAILDPLPSPAYSAIGPVAGAIIALCLVIGFAMYCYRQNLESESEQLYAESMPENQIGGMPLSRLDFNDIRPHDNDIGGHNVNRNIFTSPSNAVALSEISPYRMSSGGYRRPNGESDHGYSTMTPHEDSEHMCFAMAEPLISNKRLSVSDSTSINTSVSSPSNYNPCVPLTNDKSAGVAAAITILPTSPFHIQAPVTVHHAMEAST